MLRGKVVLLRAVSAQVVELPWIALGGDQLPIAHADGAVPFVKPPEGIVRHAAILCECGHEALAWRCGNGLTVPHVRLGEAGEFKDGRHDIHEVRGIRAQFSARRNSLRPVNDERSADAALVYPRLMAAERCV